MSGVPQFADISTWQGTIDWSAYAAWAKQWDGIARVSLRSSYGTGFVDAHYHAYLAGARAAEVTQVIHYHYAYPSLNTPEAEADWQCKVVGTTIGPDDLLMLDYEENVPEATADWAYRFLARQQHNYGGRLPTIYASESYALQRLQDARLAVYPLTLANWQFTPTERPPAPSPWQTYAFLQFSDRASIPGIGNGIDINLYFGPTKEPVVSAQTLQAQAYWNSTTTGSWPIGGNVLAASGIFPAGKTPSYDTGIAKSWQTEYLAGRIWGPPVTYEFDRDASGNPLTDWNGNQIVAQMFLGGRCEWNKAMHIAKWYAWA